MKVWTYEKLRMHLNAGSVMKDTRWVKVPDVIGWLDDEIEFLNWIVIQQEIPLNQIKTKWRILKLLKDQLKEGED